jgi:hypothetical protein
MVRNRRTQKLLTVHTRSYALITQGRAFGLGPYEPFTWRGVASAEITYTLVLCFVVLSCATVKRGAHTDPHRTLDPDPAQ